MHSGLFLQANIIHLLLQQAIGSVQEINAEFQAKQIKKVVQGNLHPISAQEARYAKVQLGGEESFGYSGYVWLQPWIFCVEKKMLLVWLKLTAWSRKESRGALESHGD